MTRQEAVNLILQELERAEKIHPKWPVDIFQQNSILAEEAGEVTKAVNEYWWSSGTLDHIKKEAIQTGAMTIRFLINL